FLVTENEDIYLIEVNTTPGMSDASIVPQQIEAAGLNLTTVFNQIISQAL
ncbi:MAG: D-alanine--D-alanine ligase, partial [Putridiphycobacter sp.]|nr:D-alanine--D-alanine ligase [Putridiphycobacter sp.]